MNQIHPKIFDAAKLFFLWVKSAERAWNLGYFQAFLRFWTSDIWQQQRLDGEVWETCEIDCDNWSTHVPCILRGGFTYLLNLNDRAVAMESWLPSKQEASNSRFSRLTNDSGKLLSSLTIFSKTGLFQKLQETNKNYSNFCAKYCEFVSRESEVVRIQII